MRLDEIPSRIGQQAEWRPLIGWHETVTIIGIYENRYVRVQRTNQRFLRVVNPEDLHPTAQTKRRKGK